MSDDGDYIHIHNVTDWSNFNHKRILTFEKKLLLNSPLFDNESFCFLERIAIGCTYQTCKYYEPVFKLDKSDAWRSILRYLFHVCLQYF